MAFASAAPRTCVTPRQQPARCLSLRRSTNLSGLRQAVQSGRPVKRTTGAITLATAAGSGLGATPAAQADAQCSYSTPAKDAQVIWWNTKDEFGGIDPKYYAATKLPGSVSEEVIAISRDGLSNLDAWFTVPEVAAGTFHGRVRMQLQPGWQVEQLTVEVVPAEGCGTPTSKTYVADQLAALGTDKWILLTSPWTSITKPGPVKIRVHNKDPGRIKHKLVFDRLGLYPQQQQGTAAATTSVFTPMFTMDAKDAEVMWWNKKNTNDPNWYYEAMTVPGSKAKEVIRSYRDGHSYMELICKVPQEVPAGEYAGRVRLQLLPDWSCEYITVLLKPEEGCGKPVYRTYNQADLAKMGTGKWFEVSSGPTNITKPCKVEIWAYNTVPGKWKKNMVFDQMRLIKWVEEEA